MAVESPNKSTISPLKFFNRTARVQEGISTSKEKLVQIDISLKKILSLRDRTIDTSKMEDEETERQEKEKKLEAGKFFVRGVGKLANAIPGKNTIQKFLLFMAFGWLFNTFSKYFGQLSGPLSKIITGSVSIIDAFSKIAFGIFDGFVTFVDIGYKTWDVIRGTGDSQKLQSALNNVLLDIDSFFGGILSLLGIVEQPPEQQVQPGMIPGTPGRSGAPGGPGGAAPSSGNLPRVSKPGQGAPTPTPQAPPSQVSGGIIPSKARITSTYGSQEGFRKKPHTGIDYGYDVGTPISLVKSGVVVEASTGYNGGYGNFILVQHSNGTYSMFNHLDQIYVKKGQKINATTGNAPVIGTIGNSGFSTGPHLDFKVATKWDGFNPGGFVDPRSYQDSVFRIGGDVKVKPSQVQKLAKKDGKEGVMIDGQWRAKPWSSAEKERYGAVSGQQEGSKVSPSGTSSAGILPIHKQALDKISQYESAGSGGYNAMNQGTVPDRKGLSPKSGSSSNIIGRNLTDMTLAEVLEYQKKSYSNDEGFIHAAGRYQFIGNTLPGLVSRSGLSLDTKFSPAVQDRLAVQLMIERGGESPWTADKRTGLLRDPAGIDLIRRAAQTPLPPVSSLSAPQSSAKSTPSVQSADVAAQEYAASKGKYYSSTTKKTYGSYSEALKDPEVKKAATKPERWAVDPRGWFGMKGGGMVEDIPKQTKPTDVSSLSSYPSYSPESEESMRVVIQPVIIKVPTPTGKDKSSIFPVPVGVNNSMGNLSNLSQG